MERITSEREMWKWDKVTQIISAVSYAKYEAMHAHDALAALVSDQWTESIAHCITKETRATPDRS